MKRLLIILGIIIVLSVVFIITYSRQPIPWDEWVKENVRYTSETEKVVKVEKRKIEPKEPEWDMKWKKWIDEQIEIISIEILEAYNNLEPGEREAFEEYIAGLNPPMTFEEYKEESLIALRATVVAKAQELIEESPVPPVEPLHITFTVGEAYLVPPLKHEGPMTPTALMESFDEEYGGYSSAEAPVEEKYPRAEWLQLCIDAGYPLTTYDGYLAALNLRWDVDEYENNPAQWASGELNIPPTDDWNTYKIAFIEARAQMTQRAYAAMDADPEVTGGYTSWSHPNVFLPAKENLVYVNRNGRGTNYFGTELTDEQRYNLTHHGIHPDGIEIIYIDNNYNVLTEKPPLITSEMIEAGIPSFITPDMLKNVELPPNDWKPSKNWEPLPGLEEALRANGWEGTFALQEEVPSNPQDIPDIRRPGQVENAVPGSIEQFDNAEHDFDRFAGMSDAELEAEFEKMFMEQFPELLTEEKVESAFRQQFKTKRLSPERFNRALDILDRHGPEKGLRRLREVDPEAATQIEQIFFPPSEEKGPPPAD